MASPTHMFTEETFHEIPSFIRKRRGKLKVKLSLSQTKKYSMKLNA
jgi:hypothetical protein